MEIRGATALVTGAAGGLGGFIARALAAEGADLVVSDRPKAKLDGLLEELRATGVRAEPLPLDLEVRKQRVAAIDAAEEALGPVDILVNNAGLEFAGPFHKATTKELEAIVQVNLLSVMELTLQALPRMLERRRGHVVNLASIAGKVGSPYLATYSATKHGVVGFTHSLRVEYGSRPVGFTAICPEFVTRVGMYGRVEHAIPELPPELGTVPPESVGAAVVDGIARNRAEILVTERPARPLVGLVAMAPGLAARAFRRPAVMEVARRFAAARGRL